MPFSGVRSLASVDVGGLVQHMDFDEDDLLTLSDAMWTALHACRTDVGAAILRREEDPQSDRVSEQLAAMWAMSDLEGRIVRFMEKHGIRD